MTKFALRYVQAFKDRHGRQRYYFRRPGLKRVPLPGKPGSTEFLAAYGAAERGETPAREVGSKRTVPGSLSALIVAYYQSAEFTTLAASTRATYRGVIERLRAEHGDKPVRLMSADRIKRDKDRMAGTPAAANARLAILRLLMRFAVDRGWRKDNPLDGIKKVRSTGGGFHTWTEEEIAAYEARWASGTRARLALALLLYTLQRRSDVIGMGRQHQKGGALHVQQQKTGARLVIPIHPTLATELAHVPADQMTFLQTAFGAPFTSAGFGNWFAECCRAAGLPKGCAAHGLRKAGSRRLAEAGCSASVIQSLTGHTTLKEVARYTAAADQEARARQGMEALSGTSSVKPARKV